MYVCHFPRGCGETGKRSGKGIELITRVHLDGINEYVATGHVQGKDIGAREKIRLHNGLATTEGSDRGRKVVKG